MVLRAATGDMAGCVSPRLLPQVAESHNHFARELDKCAARSEKIMSEDEQADENELSTTAPPSGSRTSFWRRTVSSELATLRLQVEKLQSERLHDVEQRAAANAVLRDELASFMTELQARAARMSKAEAKQ